MADESNQLRVRLVTPERTLFEDCASAVELPSKSGYFEVLYGHAPLMAELGAGDVTIHPEGVSDPASTEGSTRYNVSWGFVEVLPDRVTILASDALKPDEIDGDAFARSKLNSNAAKKDVWSEAGESEDAYDDALRVISEAEAKIASATEVEKH